VFRHVFPDISRDPLLIAFDRQKLSPAETVTRCSSTPECPLSAQRWIGRLVIAPRESCKIGTRANVSSEHNNEVVVNPPAFLALDDPDHLAVAWLQDVRAERMPAFLSLTGINDMIGKSERQKAKPLDAVFAGQFDDSFPQQISRFLVAALQRLVGFSSVAGAVVTR
jgi:hypothetical protein